MFKIRCNYRINIYAKPCILGYCYLFNHINNIRNGYSEYKICQEKYFFLYFYT